MDFQRLSSLTLPRGAATASAVFLLSGLPAFAQEAPAPAPASPGAQQIQSEPFRPRLFKASELNGNNLQNPVTSEDLGEIKDVILTSDLQRVAFLEVASGGFLGMNETVAYVPWNWLILPEEGSDAPIQANAQWIEEATVSASKMRERESWQEYDYSAYGYEETWYWGSSEYDRYPGLRLSNILNTAVYNTEDVDLGEIEEVIVDRREGRVVYALISTGNWADAFDLEFDYTVVPWSQISFTTEPWRGHLNASLETLQANAFESSSLETLEDIDYAGKLYQSYGVEPYWKANQYDLTPSDGTQEVLDDLSDSIEEDAEDARAEIEDAAEEAGDEIEDATDESSSDAVEDAGDEIEDATD
jgi:sporulation protein YlmC with PRC-barrel domain